MDKGQIVSDVEKLDMNSLKDIKAIIFIDDILGTGFSLKNNSTIYTKSYQNKF